MSFNISTASPIFPHKGYNASGAYQSIKIFDRTPWSAVDARVVSVGVGVLTVRPLYN